MGIGITSVAAATVIGVGGLGLVSMPAAQADRGPERERQKECSASSWAGLSVEQERRGIEADFDIEGGPAGQQWRLRMTHNGEVAARATRVADYEGEVDFSRRLPDSNGRDSVVVRAVSSAGEVCRVRATL